MASNQTTILDEDNESSDWIEIFNPTSSAVELQGWSLTDDDAVPQKWQFPSVVIEPDTYLVLFASGKDRATSGEELHTNFKLSAGGEYLALIDPNGKIATEFAPEYPEQYTDISYGFYNDDYVYFTVPTPGDENQFTGHQLLPMPVFNVERGFYESPFEVEISTELQNAEIYYTTDGSSPDNENGTLYSAPIEINTTTVLRAIIIKSDQMTSRVATTTYLFLDDVINQPNNPPGYPSQWGPYHQLSGNATADYEMDPEITQAPAYKDKMKDALLSLPTLSIVTDIDHFFSPAKNPGTGGIYIWTGASGNYADGNGWERPVSVEYFNADKSKEFQVDCCIRLQGGASRLPEKSPKHSLRLVFKSQYGPSKLEYPLFDDGAATIFNTITLRAGFCNSWHHWSPEQRERSQHLRDTWAKDTQLAMGHLSGRGNFVNLYINGLYWGVYNATERMDREFAASYLGGDDTDYDVIKDKAEVVDGNIDAWNKMINLANAGLSSDAAYQRIQGNNPDGTPNPDYEPLVDVVNLIDYMILNFYGGNTDWDHHNWAAMRNRVNPGKGFIFLSWDAEHILESVGHNMLDENNENCPSALFQKLRENAAFRRLFADRVQLHCFNGGVLTPQSAIKRWQKRAREIELAMIAESARWGDYRRDVHQFKNGPYYLYTKNDHWLPAQSFLIDEYFPKRTNAFINQLKQTNLFPEVSSPIFLINDENVTENTIQAGDVLSMESSSGTIYYTTDGSDPYIPETSSAGEVTVLIVESKDKLALVPKSDIGNSWRSDIGFNDSGWLLCSGSPGGIGYEKNSSYENLISLDVANDMYEDGVNPNTSCYVRIKFDVSSDDLSNINSLTLGVRYDDGFIAYLNNTKIAEANTPATISWNSAASDNHEGNSLESFNISAHINKLMVGNNLLAIQALNRATSSSDFIINVEMKGSNISSPGNISPNAIVYSEPITLEQSTHIKARTLVGNEWSALNDVLFMIPAELFNLKITEIHYHPLTYESFDDRDFEFIELKNIGASILDLSGVKFTNGISYSFPVRTALKSNEFIVLASDQIHFKERYGFLPFDEYEGFLDNSGERIALVNAANDTIINVRYNDREPWPVIADGEGYSLVPTEANPTGDQGDAANWRVSYFVHGSPGEDDTQETAIDEKNNLMTSGFQLNQNYPNPFNPSTRITYNLAKSSFVTLTIFNVLGKEVTTLVSEYQDAGSYSIPFEAKTLPSGIYFYKLELSGQSFEVKKMILMK